MAIIEDGDRTAGATAPPSPAPPASPAPAGPSAPAGLPTFPDTPRLELDELLHQLMDRAQDVLSAQGRLRGLLRANQAIVGHLALPVVLRRIVEAACELAHARYGALGVIAPDGGLEQFLTVGLDADTVARIGHLPEGKGLLGAVIADPQPIRLANMATDPRSVGFPPGHPPMSSFLGVPVRVRDEVFGNLYLAEHDGGPFRAEDEELVCALAATAGVAIENARLFEQAQHRQDWLQASTEVTRQLLAAEGEEPLRLIARKAREIADADVATVVLPTPDGQRLMVEVASGKGAEELTALSYPIEHTLVGQALDTGKAMLVSDADEPGDDADSDSPADRDSPDDADSPDGSARYAVHLSQVLPVGPVMVVPLGHAQRARGALVLGRLRGRHRFADTDLDMATTFAGHAAVALELADARAYAQRMVLLEDRDRIARDLHDHVIQRLFAAGLSVQSVAAAEGGSERGQRLTRVVDDLDETIRQIRTSIFQLRGALGPHTGTVRERLLTVAAEVAPLLGFEPQVRFTGPIDAVVPDAVVEDLLAVLREALTNAARHADATRVDIDVAVAGSQLAIDVIDDGVGIGNTVRRSGLANLRQRAERRGGSLSVGRGAPDREPPIQEGTCLRWTIPLP